ncbi:neuroendocrine convertase 1-like [Melitaea cinxia]|uniref:neuroendocrine convertase 1-like n=1 Tax=Melitaea cinxia TaxID=113334 RepID=UPI001E270B33|nr:neuroendocrine convertase 1-like [Melitaea cinxia]
MRDEGGIATVLLEILSNRVCLYSWESNWLPGYHNLHNGKETSKSFVNEWLVEMEGGEEVAQLVALELGYEFGGPVLDFSNLYIFRPYERTIQRRTPGKNISSLHKDNRIRWAEQLFIKSRVKRYPLPEPDEELRRVKRIDEGTRYSEHDESSRDLRRINRLFNDELWGYEWYLQDTRTDLSLPRLDLNVLPVYKLGYNGQGVRVSILDDGVEHNHTDLRDNYDPDISWDTNDGDPDPFPRYDAKNSNSHGTRCAGEIVMTANNKKCGVGVAWGAKVGGVRMLDGRITDRIEGEAIGYAWDKVDIYSASWGPSDDGKTVEGPGRLAIEALKRGIEKGRGGKGSIFVWANGNGGGHNDNCNCDGYSSSIYTISIGSASQQGLFPWYGEICSSTLATAYSSGAYKDQKIATTDTKDSCTLAHTGTSAAAPLAAGIIALALHANPNLTWRDVQHLIVWTSEYAPLSENPGWQINSVGLWFDVRFGFGLLNAGAIVSAALNWTTVPDKCICRVDASSSNNKKYTVSYRLDNIIEIDVTGCLVNYIEHVELIVNIQYTRRGALEIYLISPQGTEVQVLSSRPRDNSNAGFINWPLISVATWGEAATGRWKVIIQDKTNEANTGEIGPISLIIHGTSEMPAHMKNGPRKYNDNYNNERQPEFVDYHDRGEPYYDYVEPLIPEQHSTEEVLLLNDIDTITFDEIEKELLRNHHSKNAYQPVLDV